MQNPSRSNLVILRLGSYTLVWPERPGEIILRSQISFENLDASPFRFAVIYSRWNEELTSSLRDGALRALKEGGADDANIEVFVVPGSFELPLAAQTAAESERFDAVVALGVVIRGDTPHFDFVAGQTAAGLMQASLATGVPIAFGVVTTNTPEQAAERAVPGDDGNKGYEAARTAIEMAALVGSLASEEFI